MSRRRAGGGVVQLVDPDTDDQLPVWTSGGAFAPARASVPTVVRILGQRYRVLLHSRIYMDASGRQRLDGIVAFKYRVIVLDSEQPRAKMLTTLAHECAHVYLLDGQARDRRLARLPGPTVEALCDLIADAFEDRGVLAAERKR